MSDLVDLQKLREMRDNGRISVEEFDKDAEILYQKSMREAGDRKVSKNGAVYILLAGFLGVTGIHNFYAGYWGRGLIQLGLSLLSWLFLFLPLIFVVVWVLGEIFFQNKDAAGNRFGGNRSLITGLRIGTVLWIAYTAYVTWQNNEFIWQDTVVVTGEDMA
ncbi:MAG: TM2 domain-containing protein [Alphaproteobacteria bacterium]|nr:TM2 domain-containing protein [Alphaproteobacteria bacterium]